MADAAVDVATTVARDVLAPAADDVDRAARVPAEGLAALRDARLLGILIDEDLGGEGASLTEVAHVTSALGRACSSTAMVYAMHQIQVHCLVRHGSTDALRSFQREVAASQLLLASATTEASRGGDVRSSTCAVERLGDRIRLEKDASVISYGEHADAVLATARTSPDSSPNDQVLAVCRPGAGTKLTRTGGWDTLGFRGTCSFGYLLEADEPADFVLPDPFAEISAATMLPTSHLLWSSVWLGIATEAVHRARESVRTAARKTPGVTPPSALRVAELVAVLRRFEALVAEALRTYESALGDGSALGSLGFAIAMNDLKVASSELVVDITSKAMGICGIAGYREDGPSSIARLLRDAHAAPLMIGNDRILAHNAQLLLVHKGD
jgi:acyl-CoA dehydrogenase